MKIIYKNNDATQIPVYMSGTCIQIKQWLRGEQYAPFIKSVFYPELTQEDIDQLTFEKRQEEADEADRSEQELLEELSEM